MYQVLKQESGVPVAEVDPGGKDKVSRARSITGFVENERVLLRSGALWLDALLGELTMFPESEHDDQVDALVYGASDIDMGVGDSSGKATGQIISQTLKEAVKIGRAHV